MTYLMIIAGIALLILGRKLFWLFVGVVGFLFGMTIAPQLLPGLSQPVILTIALVFAVLGALLAVMVQKVAVGIAGFIAGIYLTYSLIGLLGLSLGSLIWVVTVVGGVLGALLASSMFDWAIILLSSASGAVMITDNLNLPQPLGLALLIGLFVVGVIIQGNLRSKD